MDRGKRSNTEPSNNPTDRVSCLSYTLQKSRIEITVCEFVEQVVISVDNLSNPIPMFCEKLVRYSKESMSYRPPSGTASSPDDDVSGSPETR